jgi:hypothetical protein
MTVIAGTGITELLLPERSAMCLYRDTYDSKDKKNVELKNKE